MKSHSTTERTVHTPAPWSIGDPTQVQHDYPKRYVSESVSVHGPERACVATVYAGHEGGSVGRPYVSLEDGRANARLIAAAPKLVGALTVGDIDQIVEGIENFVMGPISNAELDAIWQPYVDKLHALRMAIVEAGGQ